MDKIQFTVNGEKYTLTGAEVGPSTSLNDYLRDYLQLFGTKAMCHEGGCGACVVAASPRRSSAGERRVIAVNSCLVHILSCHEWDITTVEGVGSRRDGYHAIQSRLADFNGTQCGYCSPGMVMNMYSLYQSTSRLTMQQVEKSFGGNICRCTGYRPILDAFKSFANDLDPSLQAKLQDVEDLDKTKCLKKCSRSCSEDDWCIIEKANEESFKDITVQGGRWYKAYTVQDVFKVLTREGSSSYTLVAGNTGQGVFPLASQPKILIDIASIEALRESLADENLIIGAGTTLTDFMDICQRWSSRADFSYLTRFYEHLELVAHVPVRNIGTIGGNLAMKNMQNGFPSDVFLLLETVGTVITLINNNLKKLQLNLKDFMKTNLKDILILDVRLPPLSESNLIRTYKIMPRAQNAHAIVNAGFLFKLDAKNRVESSNIVFGNISSTFVNAKDTIQFLKGQELYSEQTLQKALMTLKEELVPEDVMPEPSPQCRKSIALGLFYKAILSLCPTVSPRYKSGGEVLVRGVSKSTQTFDTDKSLWPLNQPVPKLEGLTQCSGEADYACDVGTGPRGVQLAFVLSQICKGDIEGIDATEVLALPGVIAFFTAKDIPGKNSFTPASVPWQNGDEEILASSVSYHGQPIGLVAASTRKLALTAAGLVKVRYKPSGDKPVLNVRDALRAPDKDRRVRQEYLVEPKDRGTDIVHVITGSFTVPSQYHFSMETQSCTVRDTPNGVEVRAATQWMDLVNVAVGDALGIDHSRVHVIVPRVGGAYGGKASRSAQVACAAAVAARALQRPATFVMSLKDNMAAIGKRQRCDFDYEVGVNHEGLIQYLNITSYSDVGCAFSDSVGDLSAALSTLYDGARWRVQGYSVLTDTASNTWCRAPGTTEATAIVEHIMDRIAYITSEDPTDIRLQHLSPDNAVMRELVSTFQRGCDFQQRREEIRKYNEENAWKKKALNLSIMAYPIDYSWNFPVTVSLYHGDGGAAVAHGGVEMGQGVNTKAAQVAAHALGIPLDKVTVHGSDSFSSPNAMVSNGSITSDCIAFATARACEELLRRLQPVRAAMDQPSWQDLVTDAFNKGVNLQASYMTSPKDALRGYRVYGACAAELELDALTGGHAVRRVDILEDTGVSLSPDIDVGQIEGAFVMGLGLWTSEHLVFDPASGRLASDRTWWYKPPGARDVPEDFRVGFRRNAPNPAGVLRSKATGEPALVLAVSVPLALHRTIFEARKEFGYTDTDWVHVDSPYSVENILKAISPTTDHYKLH